MQPSNQVFNYPEQQHSNQPTQINNRNSKTTVTKEGKRKFEGNCRYCNIVDHKEIECRKRLRDTKTTTALTTREQHQLTTAY